MANGNQVTLQHGGAYEITLSRSGERGLVVEVFDMEEDASSVAPMTTAEWDAFVAAGHAALGRPAPVVVSEKATELAESLAHLPDAQVEEMARNYRAAREAGPTVPRGVVAAVLALHAQIAEESGEYRANLIEALLTALDVVRADLAAPTEAR